MTLREWKDPLGQPVPSVTTEQMREVDRAMVSDHGIQLIQMMELAGRHLAHVVRDRFLHGDPARAMVLVLAGTGGNGGGALVAARRLHAWGARVRVITAAPPDAYSGVPLHQLETLARLRVPTTPWDEAAAIRTPNVVVDGVIGYSLAGAPRGGAATMIRWTHGTSAPVVSLDVPSGLDATTGVPAEPTVLAAATLTLALPKTGLGNPDAADHVGDLYVADIGVPPEVYVPMGLEVGPVFAETDVVQLR